MTTFVREGAGKDVGMAAPDHGVNLATPTLTNGAGSIVLTALVMARVTNRVEKGAERGPVFVPVTARLTL